MRITEPENTSPPDGAPDSALRRTRTRDVVQVLGFTVALALFLKLFVVEAYRIPTASMENTVLRGDFLIVNKLVYGPRTPRFLPFTDIKLPSLRLPAIIHPRAGDVVVFDFPEEEGAAGGHGPVHYVKRCVAGPGDTVSIVERTLIVNNRALALPGRGKQAERPVLPGSIPNVHIFPQGAVFNEDNYGPVLVPKSGSMVQLNAMNIAGWSPLIEHEGHLVTRDRVGGIYVDGVLSDSYRVQRDYYFMLGDNRDESLDSRFRGFVPDDMIVGKAIAVYWSWDEPERGTGQQGKFASVRWSRIGTLVR